MNHQRGLDRSQTLLFPERLEDYIGAENPVRFLDAFVGSLDLHALGFARAQCAATGRPPYDPAMLLKLYLYGYLHRIRSSRLLEAECHRNVEVIWLTGKQAPDHKTIADFRKDNAAGPSPRRFALAHCSGSPLSEAGPVRGATGGGGRDQTGGSQQQGCQLQ